MSAYSGRILPCEVCQELCSIRLIFWWAGANKKHGWHLKLNANAPRQLSAVHGMQGIPQRSLTCSGASPSDKGTLGMNGSHF